MIHPCGDHLTTRNCQSSRRGINIYRPLKIRFIPKNYRKKDTKEYYDFGEVFGATGHPYGNYMYNNRMEQSNDSPNADK